jgi:pimeloyl-ACP methyl ester carboxylesterase
MKLLKISVLALALAAMLVAAAGDAQAQYRTDHYAVVAFHNPTDSTLNYQFRWGNGEWKTASVLPGHWRYHWWAYDYPNQGRSPVPQVKFDQDLSSGFLWRSYDLEAYRSPEQGYRFAKQYRFVVRDYGARLDVVSVN